MILDAVLKRQIFNNDNVKGEIVNVFIDSQNIIIVFADGRFVYYKATSQWDDLIIEIQDDAPGVIDLHNAGLISKADRDKVLRTAEEERKAQINAGKLEEYERLKKELGL